MAIVNHAQQNTTADILLIDDTPEDVQYLTQVLTKWGYQVHTLSDGQDAASVIQRANPELVLLDIDLDCRLHDYDICQQLRESEQTRDVPIIFITESGKAIDQEQILSAGGIDYLTKPFRNEEVLARIETHLALQRRNYQLNLLNRVGQDLTATLNLQRIAEQVQEAVTEVVNAVGTSVWLVDREEEDRLVCQVAFHEGLEQFSLDLNVRAGQGVVGWVMETGQNVLLNDVASDPRFFSGIDQKTGFQTHSLLAVPLRARDKVIGVLEVVNKRGGGFDTYDLILVETMAASAAIAIDNTWLFEALCQHAIDVETSNAELQAALAEVKALSGLLPICFNCKKIRDDAGYWQQIETYISARSDAEFSHGLCADCAQELYPDIYQKSLERRQDIKDALAKLQRATAAEIAEAVGQLESNTQNRLHDMQTEGLLKAEEVDGEILYELADS
jgi:DNA-binding response OmpR family regulator